MKVRCRRCALAGERSHLTGVDPGDGRYIALALVRQVGSDRSAADAALRTLIEKQAVGAPYQTAEVYALRNDANATFEWLDNVRPSLSAAQFVPPTQRKCHNKTNTIEMRKSMTTMADR